MTMKEIVLDGGVKVTLAEPPPAGFDPLAASASDLLRYGLPARPDSGPHLERYKRVFGQLKSKIHFIQPTFQVNANKRHGPRQRRVGDAPETSTNWSGGVVYAPSGQSFKWVEGDWVVPDVGAPTQNQWYYCASWIGIDGDQSPDVCQAGVECQVYQSGSSVTRTIYPWWEWYPNPEVQITNLPVSPGDMITMLICSTQGAGSTSATVYFTNRTTGATATFTTTPPSGYQLVGNCAEWIVEAPTVGGAQSAIADYGETFFSVCEAVTNSGTTVDGGTGDSISLVNGTTLSQGVLVTPTIVQCLYEGTVP
jgi:Peptidase A4 family